jgi:Gpi18-like mannosyltransferase
MPWGYHSDVTATYWWGKFAADFGLRGFYNWLNFGGYGHPDQPMINIYYDLFVRWIYQIFYQILWFLNIHLPIFPSKLMIWYVNFGNQILLKLPMVIADILLIYFCYRFAQKYFTQKQANLIALIISLYPPLIYNSALWGSGDSIVNLFALLSVYFIWQKKYISSTLFMIISILYKPSLLIWLPIFLIIAIKNKINFKNILAILISSFVFLYLICFPFTPLNTNPLIWFFQTMTVKILPGFMPHLTANAMNFWALLFGLQLHLDNLMFFNLISARNLSLIVCSLFYLYLLFKLYRRFTLPNLLLTLVSFTLVTFTFMTRMHERYSYPALIPLLLLCFYDRRFTKYFVLLSLTHFYNVLCAWWFPALLYNYPLVVITSIINIFITLKLVFIYPSVDKNKGSLLPKAATTTRKIKS